MGSEPEQGFHFKTHPEYNLKTAKKVFWPAFEWMQHLKVGLNKQHLFIKKIQAIWCHRHLKHLKIKSHLSLLVYQQKVLWPLHQARHFSSFARHRWTYLRQNWTHLLRFELASLQFYLQWNHWVLNSKCELNRLRKKEINAKYEAIQNGPTNTFENQIHHLILMKNSFLWHQVAFILLFTSTIHSP